MTNPVLLLTRPLAQSREFASAFSNERVVISPLTRIDETGVQPDLDGVGGLIFTSVNGVRAYLKSEKRRNLPAFAVGQATADLCRRAGIETRSADGNAQNLVNLIRAAAPDAPLLHIRGEHTVMDLGAALATEAIEIRSQILYRQSPAALTNEARAELCRENPVIVPLFSPRSAAQFVRQHLGCAPLHVAAMSRAVAAAMNGLKCETCVIAKRPDAAAMLREVTGLLDAARIA